MLFTTLWGGRPRNHGRNCLHVCSYLWSHIFDLNFSFASIHVMVDNQDLVNLPFVIEILLLNTLVGAIAWIALWRLWVNPYVP